MNTADTINDTRFDIKAILRRIKDLVDEYEEFEPDSCMDSADFLTDTINTLEVLLNEFRAYTA